MWLSMIGNRPWNAKAIQGKKYQPEKHPYTLWTETPAGEEQIGCIDSAQRFEFDKVGVIGGEDKWVAEREKSFDPAVRVKTADTQELLRNAYRVLLTRGIGETQLLCRFVSMVRPGSISPNASKRYENEQPVGLGL